MLLAQARRTAAGAFRRTPQRRNRRGASALIAFLASGTRLTTARHNGTSMSYLLDRVKKTCPCPPQRGRSAVGAGGRDPRAHQGHESPRRRSRIRVRTRDAPHASSPHPKPKPSASRRRVAPRRSTALRASPQPTTPIPPDPWTSHGCASRRSAPGYAGPRPTAVRRSAGRHECRQPAGWRSALNKLSKRVEVTKRRPAQVTPLQKHGQPRSGD